GGAAPKQPVRVAATAARHDRFEHARSLFREMCAGCHTLADAGTDGPRSDLDTSVLERIDRHARAYVARVAMSEDPSNGGFMPRWKGVLTQRDFEALVDYIVAVTGRNAPHES
ncbi:MAG: cytochrome c, partial [Bradyrhizobium sp.]